MKSLAVSVGFPSPRTQYQQANTYYLTQKNLEKKDNDLHLLAVGAKHNDLIASHTLPASSFLEHATQLDVVGRRDVIKGGAFIGILASILVSSEFAEASCDFTSSPSGLAFCDQIVGTGPQASKGQLIKVPIYFQFILLNLLFHFSFFICDHSILFIHITIFK